MAKSSGGSKRRRSFGEVVPWPWANSVSTSVPGDSIVLVDSDGKPIKKTVTPPTVMPDDLSPGELVMIPNAQKVPEWFVLCDKQRVWANGRWNQFSTISPFDPALPAEEIYRLRAKLLRIFGWIP